MHESNSFFFLRHSKLLLPYKEHANMPFSVLSDLGLYKLNPPIDRVYTDECLAKLVTVIPFEKINTIYSSPSLRCQDSAKAINEYTEKVLGKIIECVTLPELEEVYFNLEKLDTVIDVQSAVKQKGVAVAVNSGVFWGMMAGIHGEPILKVQERVRELFKMIQSLPEGKYIFLTHDFLMRVIEIYIRSKGDINHVITYEELLTTRRNLYLQGFSTNSSLSTFSDF